MKFSLRPTKFALYRRDSFAHIVGDGAIATSHVGDGRLIPLIILDNKTRPDLAEFIRLHEHLPPGDVTAQWGQIEGRTEDVVLSLSFQRPSELTAVIEFNIAKQGILVEQILTSKALYIQAGQGGDRIKHNLNAPKIIVEIADMGFRAIWDDLFYRQVVKHMRESGLNRQQAKRAATQAIDMLRRFGELRMPHARGEF